MPETTPLEDATAFFAAMRSTHGRAPALKQLGRMLLRWLVGGVVFAACVAAGQIFALGAGVAFHRYALAWLVTAAAIPLIPLSFVAVMSTIELALVWLVAVPILLFSHLVGRRASAIARRVFYWGLLAFLGFMVAGTARNFVVDGGNVASSSSQQSTGADVSAAASHATISGGFSYPHAVIGALLWLGGIVTKTVGDVLSAWMKRAVLSPGRRVLLYGPHGRSLDDDDRGPDER